MAEGMSAAVDPAVWLDEASSRSFAHCGAFAAAWLREAFGVGANGREDLTLRAWARLLRRHGGLISVAEAEAARLGLKRAKTPAPGQVGLVPVPVSNGRSRPVCTIITPGLRCAVWVGSGVALIAAEPARLWEV